MDITSTPAEIRSVIRDHIVNQLRKRPASHYYDAVSFYSLSKKEKRELAAYELANPRGDGWDMILNHDGHEITKLIFAWKTGLPITKNPEDKTKPKKITARKALNNLLDSIIKRYATSFDEMFDDEFSSYLADQEEAGFAIRECIRAGDFACESI